KVTLSLLKKYLRPYVKQVLIVAFLLIGYNVIQVFNPQIIRLYLDQATADTLNKIDIIWTAVLYIGMNLIFRIIFVILRWLSQELAWATTNDLRVDLTRHCVNLDMTFHNKQKTGEMIERIDGDASTLSEFFSTFTIYFAGSFLLLIGVMIAVFVEGWIYGLAFLGFILVAVIVLYFLRRLTSPLWKKVRESTTALYGNIEESVSGLEDVKGSGADEFIMKRYHGIAQTNYKNKNKAMIISRVYYIANVSMSGILNIGILLLSYFLMDYLSVDGSVIYLLLSYATNILFPLRLILWQLEQLQNSIANIDRINEWFELESKIKDVGETEFPQEKVNLVFDDLNFGYLENELVLKNISFDLEPGKKIGIVGRTGSGKTTLARLMFRLYDPISGSIKINGHQSNDFPLKDLRQNVAYVTQEVELFKASIKDNITFFDSKYTDEEIIEVINNLGLREWFNKLPNGLETEVYSEELGLSAGEAQLLALTRAFLKNPKIVILDEASSRLDPATERIIETALNNLLENRSALVIAHRLTTLDKVDKILILEKGEIVEYGYRKDLVKDPKSNFSLLLQQGMEEVLQ
ncbi:MAG: ABC transporter ATP-binding protein, partial [Candidatus Heimdallarchaeota archaeon]